MKSTRSTSDDETQDDQLYGVILSTGQELFGYLPEPTSNHILMIHKPLLGIKQFEQNIENSVMILHPWSIVTDMEFWPINTAHVVAIYPVTKNIRMNHEMVWNRAAGLLASKDSESPQLVGPVGTLSENAVLVIPPQREPH